MCFLLMNLGVTLTREGYSRPSESEYHSSERRVWTNRGNNLGVYFLNLRKPFITDVEVSMELGDDENWINHTKQNGFDGVIGTINNPFFEIKNLSTDESVGEIIALNPKQIKSANDNNGMFSTEDDDIQMAMSDYYIEIDNNEEIETLRHDLFNKFKKKYLMVV